MLASGAVSAFTLLCPRTTPARRFALGLPEIRQRGCGDTSVLDSDPFCSQPPGLLLECARCTGEGDATAAAHDSMPREIQVIGRHPERKSCLACTPGKTCGPRDSTVG